jgi:hypothetical protein
VLNDTIPKNQEFDYQTMNNQPETQSGCFNLNKKRKNMSIQSNAPEVNGFNPKTHDY